MQAASLHQYWQRILERRYWREKYSILKLLPIKDIFQSSNNSEEWEDKDQLWILKFLRNFYVITLDSTHFKRHTINLELYSILQSQEYHNMTQIAYLTIWLLPTCLSGVLLLPHVLSHTYMDQLISTVKTTTVISRNILLWIENFWMDQSVMTYQWKNYLFYSM